MTGIGAAPHLLQTMENRLPAIPNDGLAPNVTVPVDLVILVAATIVSMNFCIMWELLLMPKVDREYPAPFRFQQVHPRDQEGAAKEAAMTTRQVFSRRYLCRRLAPIAWVAAGVLVATAARSDTVLSMEFMDTPLIGGIKVVETGFDRVPEWDRVLPSYLDSLADPEEPLLAWVAWAEELASLPVRDRLVAINRQVNGQVAFRTDVELWASRTGGRRRPKRRRALRPTAKALPSSRCSWRRSPASIRTTWLSWSARSRRPVSRTPC